MVRWGRAGHVRPPMRGGRHDPEASNIPEGKATESARTHADAMGAVGGIAEFSSCPCKIYNRQRGLTGNRSCGARASRLRSHRVGTSDLYERSGRRPCARNCGSKGRPDDPQVNALRPQQRRNFFATLLLSQGVPMILGSDEFGRTQRSNNNACVG